jgi:mono/diheme cytochrome c family protein
MRTTFLQALLVFGLALLSGTLSREAQAQGTVSFNRDIRPILSNTCFGCHGPDDKARKADLRLDTEDGLFGDRGDHAVVVRGKPEQSEMIARITASEPAKRMPPRKSGKKLTPQEIDLIARWIKQGAPFARHWAYSKPIRPALPKVKDSNWPKNPIDSFLLSRLEREGLRPSPEADRYALIRRLSLDLTGLPPALEEVDAFVNDRDPEAYEKLVDRLLAKTAYGEHWAHLWLDLARYADSAGYADDPLRTIWLFRDYAIRALNANKPFDQFTIEQIAGDLLPNPTREQLIATAFHRNTLTNNEGGTDREEFRNVAIVDRVNTTMAVWMGTTINCAQCHNHKYDPITQEEFFRFFALFNNTADADRPDEAPVLSIFTGPQEEERKKWQAEIARLEAELRAPRPVTKAGQTKWESIVLERLGTPLVRTQDELARRNRMPPLELRPINRRLGELSKKLDELKPVTVPIMRELPQGQRRVTKIQHRGNFLDVGKVVSEGTPAAFPALPEGAPRSRLTLAKWLVDENNPLTARVIVNRYWEQIFGIGIVATSEEFGAQGELPYHPELLDWLATELVRLNWDLKAFLKQLVTSAAYRQSSRVTPDLEQRDPDNRLLARGPRIRLSAEMVRDQALAVSGLLSGKMYGPPVHPPQPALGISAAFGSGIDWQTSTGEDRYRRALYTMWRRSNPYPSMATFDAPNREVCTVRRSRTNTPLQALVTLNDPVYLEAAQALARKIVTGGGSTTPERARYAFRLCLSRPPHDSELARLVQLYEQAFGRLQPQPEQARKLAAESGGPPAELAAWTVVGNVLLNLDEMLMKR